MKKLWKPDKFQLRHKHNTKKLSAKQQVTFFELLADLLVAGFQLQAALNFMQQILSGQQEKIQEMIGCIESGQAFGEAIMHYVDDDISLQLQLAEAHGSLSDAIIAVANTLRLHVQQVGQLKRLLQYPLCLLVMLGGMTIAIRVYLLPELASWQNNLQATNGHPWSFYCACGVGAVTLATMFWGSMKWYRKRSPVQRLEWSMKIPIIRDLIRQHQGYRFSQNLSLLMRSGHSIQQVSQLYANLPSKSFLAEFGQLMQNHLAQGYDVPSFIQKVPFLPAELALFFVRGKTNLQIAEDLRAYSQIAFQRLTTSYNRLLSIVQPLLFTLIAVAIVAIYASMLLPMYKLMGNIS
ncbi:competence type IV pilus assembly protein ComGB [Periweissella cryptocerci]|uniref:competence type IV pilus assembly protein ComGB n=1 Tax=Periweissella cryptocerci TaxID=2506420 RepID=UPI001404C217|nr:competence type IV pilus assembly protein ComGB [Periweissella cryptocerci]